jgi:hypothetical protein
MLNFTSNTIGTVRWVSLGLSGSQSAGPSPLPTFLSFWEVGYMPWCGPCTSQHNTTQSCLGHTSPMWGNYGKKFYLPSQKPGNCPLTLTHAARGTQANPSGSLTLQGIAQDVRI